MSNFAEDVDRHQILDTDRHQRGKENRGDSYLFQMKSTLFENQGTAFGGK
jgi:hypothetical protein